MNDAPPVIENAPGLVWKRRLVGWEARWQCRTDLAKRGYSPTSCRIWKGAWPDDLDKAFIVQRCTTMQDDMLFFGRGGPAIISNFTGDVRSLIACYETDKDSPYKKLEYKTRETYGSHTRRIMRDMGDLPLESIKARDLLRFHEKWIEPNEPGGPEKIAMGHGLIGMFRTLVNFGATILESAECERLSGVLHKMKFKMGKPRTSALTFEQAEEIRAMAHQKGLHSIALAQAFQYECILRQKDVIGDWVPVSEPGLSDVVTGNEKWIKGIRWDEINSELVLRHITSKRKKLVEPSLRNAPMVMEEFARIGELPKTGPIIVSELTGVPWTAVEFRRQWRLLARACGIPDNVRNMDSRAGAITEALLAGAPMDSVRKTATHATPQMTARYSRGDQDASNEVAQFRIAGRNKKRTTATGTDGEPG